MGQAGYRGAGIRRAGWSSAAALACAIWPAIAPAQVRQGPLRLEWSVPAGSGCASYDEIRLQVGRLSERTLFAAEGIPVEHTIAGVIEPHETTWRARIALRDAAGRELGAREVTGRSPTCRTLNVPVALVIVTLADSLLGPATTAASTTRERPAPVRKPRVTLPERRTGSGEDEHPGERAQPVLGLGAFGAIELNALPSPAAGVSVGLELRVPLPLSLDAALYAPVDDVDAQDRGARFYLAHAGLAACPELAIGEGPALRGQLCAAGHLGAVSGSGLGLTQAKSATRLIALLGVEPKLVWHMTPSVTARASILAGWVVIRPNFRLDIEGQAPRIVRSGPVALQLRVGIMGFAL